MKRTNKLLMTLSLFSLVSTLSGCSKNVNSTSSSAISSSSSTTSSSSTEPEVTPTFKYTVSKTNEITITSINDDIITDLVIPDEIDGKKVVSVVLEKESYGTNVKSIKFGKNVSSMSLYNVYFQNLEKIEVDSENQNYLSNNNCVIKRSNDSNYKTIVLGCKTSIIPNDGSQVTIDSFAFANSNIEIIHIPANVIVISSSAFAYCNDLLSFEVDSENTNFRAVNNCLIYNYIVRKGDAPIGVVRSATKNSTIPTDPDINYFDTYAFTGIDVKEVNIPNNITRLYLTGNDSSCFKDSGVEKITFDENSTITDLNKSMYNASKLKEVHLPDALTSLADNKNHFIGCVSLEKVYFNSKVSEYNYTAFKDCQNINEIIVPSDNKNFRVSDDKFLILDQNNGGTTYLARYFGNEENLIANGALGIYEGCFAYNNRIKNVTFSRQISTIGRSIFAYSSLETFSFGESEITAVGEYMFDDCKNLKEIVLPDSVTTINDYSFDDAKIEKLVISSSMATINRQAFRRTEIGELEIDENNPNYAVKNGHILTKDETTLIRGFPDKNGKIDVPNTVKTINQYSLSYSTMLYLNIPSFVTTISQYAVYGNDNLKSINLDANITNIARYAFATNTNLTNLKLPNTVKYIYEYAFYGCYKLKVITIPTSVTSIDQYAFMWCHSLEIINFKTPDGVASKLTKIGTRAFKDLSKLKSVEIPASVTSIGDEFLIGSGCENLVLETNKIVFTSKTLGTNSVKTLKYYGTKADFKKSFTSKAIFSANFPKIEKIQLKDDSGNFIDVLPSELTW